MLRIFVVFLSLCNYASAAQLIVNSTNTEILADGLCSLNEAIVNANLDQRVFSDCLAGQQTDEIILQQAEIEISQPLASIASEIIIKGDRTVIDGRWQNRGFHVASSAMLTLEGFTLTHMSDQSDGLGGGAILNYGQLILKNMSLNENQAEFGGAVASMKNATLEVYQSEFIGNYANKLGGALYLVENSNSLVEQSLIESSYAITSGSAIYTGHYAKLDITAVSLLTKDSSNQLHAEQSSQIWFEDLAMSNQNVFCRASGNATMTSLDNSAEGCQNTIF